LNPVEMNMPNLESVVARVAASQYAHLFIDYFGPDFFEDAVWAYDEIAHLIAAYERSAEINPFNSRFDRNELTVAETRGFDAFQQACNSCHTLTPPADAPAAVFTTYGYANIGIPNNAIVNPDQDLGLGYVKTGEDGKFKIPTLRNIAETAPYSHNGYFSTLEAMVNFHIDRGLLTPDVEVNLVAPVTVDLSAQEITDIVAFLGALTDGQ
ncbi:MAG: c-type cytochrome, partial [Spirochaetales bacterium]|nr:c-type cytochrome [Spirochaetales bacterium]